MGVLAVALVAGLSSTIISIGDAGKSDQAASASSKESPDPTDSAQPSATPSPKPSALELDRSRPQRLVIRAIGVDSKLLQLGVNKQDESVELPSPVTRAGWYKRSAAPGQAGVAVITGYIRAPSSQPGVFSHLRALHRKDVISVRRKDGKVAVFRVTAIRSYRKGTLPAKKIYAATHKSVLRLITTGGTLRPDDPPGNVVVSSRLVAVR